jgi:AbrB family looped-hinge helix DNA binding protein
LNDGWNMETVKVSKKYQVVIPEKLRHAAKIRPGDEMMVTAKRGILRYVPVRSIEETKGMIPGIDTTNLRDEEDRI